MSKLPNINCIYYKQFRCISPGHESSCDKINDGECKTIKNHIKPPPPTPPPPKRYYNPLVQGYSAYNNLRPPCNRGKIQSGFAKVTKD
jgi:hypothetical protein